MTTWTLDEICELTNKPALLNALHACRNNHPLGKTMQNPWHNAWFICAQQPSYLMPSDALEWLHRKATEGGLAL